MIARTPPHPQGPAGQKSVRLRQKNLLADDFDRGTSPLPLPTLRISGQRHAHSTYAGVSSRMQAAKMYLLDNGIT